MKDNGEKRWQTYLKNLPKPVGIGIFFGICGMVAILILAHNNPLAPDQHTEDLKKYCACALLVLACIIFGLYYDRMFIIPRELYHSRKLIWKLSKNDFKKRYAGSYLGFVWALVQPVVTVVMYWLVFDKVFNTKAIQAAVTRICSQLKISALRLFSFSGRSKSSGSEFSDSKFFCSGAFRLGLPNLRISELILSILDFRFFWMQYIRTT